MLELGAHVDPRRKNGKTPLHEAAEPNQAEFDVAEGGRRLKLYLWKVSHRWSFTVQRLYAHL